MCEIHLIVQDFNEIMFKSISYIETQDNGITITSMKYILLYAIL